MRRNPCDVCGSIVLTIDTKIVNSTIMPPQYVYSERCTYCNNLLYGHCKDASVDNDEGV